MEKPNKGKNNLHVFSLQRKMYSGVTEPHKQYRQSSQERAILYEKIPHTVYNALALFYIYIVHIGQTKSNKPKKALFTKAMEGFVSSACCCGQVIK